MVIPKLKSLTSPDLTPPALPNDPECFSIPFEAVVGPSTMEGGDLFSFTAVSAGYLASQSRTTWGRGLLIVPDFSWPTIHSAMERLLNQAMRATWSEVATELNKVLCWEFDNYQRAKA